MERLSPDRTRRRHGYMIRSRQMVVGTAALAASVYGIAAPALGGPPRFSTPSHYNPPGIRVADIAVGDLNRDGRSDVLVAAVGGGAFPGIGAGETSVLMASRGGLLSAPQPLSLAGSGNPTGGHSVAIGDMNGDGRPDVVRAWTEYFSADPPENPSVVAVLFGDGHGTFPTRNVTSTRCCPDGIAVGEFTGDGKRDLAAVSRDGRGWLLVGDGAGGFTAGPPNVGFVGGSPIQPVVADLDRDRRADLLVHNGAEEPHTPTVQYGDGKGGFSHAKRLRTGLAPAGSGSEGVESFVVGRFNGDRWPDLALTVVRFDNYRHRVQVLLGTDGRRFRLGGAYSLRPYPRTLFVNWGIVAADINGDRKQDLTISGPPSRRAGSCTTLRVLLGRGKGAFGPSNTAARCYGDMRLSVGFFNRDRKPDLASVSTRAGDPPDACFDVVSVLLNKPRR